MGLAEGEKQTRLLRELISPTGSVSVIRSPEHFPSSNGTTREVVRRARTSVGRMIEKATNAEQEINEQREARRQDRLVRQNARRKLGRFAFLFDIRDGIYMISDKLKSNNDPPGTSRSDAIARTLTTPKKSSDRWFF